MWKATVSADVAVIHNVTLTPSSNTWTPNTASTRRQQGMKDSRKWSAGTDVTYLMNPDTSFMVGYMYEWGSQLLFGINCTDQQYRSPIRAPVLPITDQRHDHRAYVHRRGALRRHPAKA